MMRLGTKTYQNSLVVSFLVINCLVFDKIPRLEAFFSGEKPKLSLNKFDGPDFYKDQ